MIRVAVVDDSATARHALVGILSAAPDIDVVGQATDGADGVAMVDRLRPDVVTMDIRMPTMDGYEATQRIMSRVATPIIMVSAHEPDDVGLSFRALDAGAVTVLAKPPGPADPNHDRVARELVATVRTMAGLKLVTRRSRSLREVPGVPGAGVIEGRPSLEAIDVVAIGASTGGPMALATILRSLPDVLPVPVVLVQHIAEGFDLGLASWLDMLSSHRVIIGRTGDRPRPGDVVVAPNNRHMGLSQAGRIMLAADPPISGHRPAVTHLFASVAASYGPRALGVILTGIGADGLEGLVSLHSSGGAVIAQDEESSIVWGMPGVAVRAGVADRVLPIDAIGPAIWNACTRRSW